MTFDDDGAYTAINLAAGVIVAPNKITFANSAQNYSLIGSGMIASGASIIKTGSGALAIASTVGFTGGNNFNISAGTFSSANTTALSLAMNVRLSGDVTLGDSANSGMITFTGSHTFAADCTISVPLKNTIKFNGPTTLPVSATIYTPASGGSNGNLIFNGTNTLTANTTLTTPSAYGRDNFVTLSGALTDGAASYRLIKEGDGGLKLGTANSYDGGTTINGGVLYAQNAASFGSGEVVVENGVQALIAGPGTIANAFKISGLGVPLPGIAGEAPDGAIHLNFSNQFLTGPITLTGDSRITGYFSSNNTISGTIRDDAYGPCTLDLGSPGAVNGCGTLTLTGNNSYRGGTYIDRIVLRAWHNSAFGTGDIVIGSGGSTTLITRLEVGRDITLSNNIILGSTSKTDGTVNYGEITGYPGDATTSSAAILSGTIEISDTPTNGGHFAAAGHATNSILKVMGPITAWVPVLVSTGNVELGGGGTGYPALTLFKDTLRVAATDGIATSAVVTLGTTGNATLDLAGFNQTLVGLVKSTNSATVTNSFSATAATLRLAPVDAANEFGGTFVTTTGAALNLAIAGSHPITLSGTSTLFTGTTTVGNGGTLDLAGTLGAATSSASCGSGGTLSGQGTFGGSLSLTNGAAIKVKPTAGYLTVNGNVVVTGVVTVKMDGLPGATTTILKATNGLSATAANFVIENAGNYQHPTFVIVGNEVTLTTETLSLTWTGAASSIWNVDGAVNWTDGGSALKFLNGDAVAFTDTPGSDQTIDVSTVVQPGAMTFTNHNRNCRLQTTASGAIEATTLTKTGAGTTTFALPLALSGTLTLNGGKVVMELPEDAADSAWTFGSAIAGTATLATSAAAGTTIELSHANTGFSGILAAEKGELILSDSQVLGSGTLKLGSAGNPVDDHPVVTLGNGVAIANPVVADGTADLATISGTGKITGGASLIKSGPGILDLSTANDFTGPITLVVGTLRSTLADSFPATSTITFGSAATGAADTILSIPATIGSPLVLSAAAPASKAILRRASGPADCAGSVSLNGRDLNVEDGGITLNGAISGAGGVVVDSNSPFNPVTLANPANAFTGSVTVRSGGVQALSGSAIPDLATVALLDSAVFMVGANETINAVTGPATATVLPNNGPNPTALTVGAGNSYFTFDGQFHDQGSRLMSLVKTGGGTLTLTGISTATGPLRAKGGTVIVLGTCAFQAAADTGGTLAGTGTISRPGPTF